MNSNTELQTKYNRLLENYKLLKADFKDRTTELIDINKKLSKSNAELKDFAFTISHDLKEPLRTIDGYCSLLDDKYSEQVDEKGKKFLKYIVGGSRRMIKLVTDLYKFSIAIDEKPSVLTSSTKSYIMAMNNLVYKVNETKAQVTQGDLPVVLAEETQLVQVFQNILGNAFKFSSPDRPLKIHTDSVIKGNQCIFSIQDNGIGIDQRYLNNIFKIFVRVGQKRGTGIGLAISKKIIEQHDGRIWVESKLKEGSTFYFSLFLA